MKSRCYCCYTFTYFIYIKKEVEIGKKVSYDFVTDVVDAAQDTWDNDNVSGETSAEKIARLGSKPTDITLP